MKRLTRGLIVLFVGSMLAACGGGNDVATVPPNGMQLQPQPQQYQQQQPQYADQQQYQQGGNGQPVIINQAPAQSSGMSDVLLGGAIGYMMGNAGNNSGQVRERVVERQVQTPAPRQQYQQPQAAPKQPVYSGWSKPAASRPAVTQQAAKPAYSGWSKPAATKSASAPRPSYGGFSKKR